jgi:hypothetical protein
MSDRHIVACVALVCGAVGALRGADGWGWFIFVAFVCI